MALTGRALPGAFFGAEAVATAVDDCVDFCAGATSVVEFAVSIGVSFWLNFEPLLLTMSGGATPWLALALLGLQPAKTTRPAPRHSDSVAGMTKIFRPLIA